MVNSILVRSVLSAYKAFKWRFQLGSEIDMSKAQGRLVWNFSVYRSILYKTIRVNVFKFSSNIDFSSNPLAAGAQDNIYKALDLVFNS